MTREETIKLVSAVLALNDEVNSYTLPALRKHGLAQCADDLEKALSRATDATEPVCSDETYWDALGIRIDPEDEEPDA